jgi:hypothetical protein
MITNARILLGTPTYDQTVTVRYMNAIRDLDRRLWETRPGVKLETLTLYSAVVHFARNAFASIVYHDKTYTHLLFVDADIGFRPEAVLKMLDFDKDLVGCICPARRTDFGRLHAVARLTDDPRLARHVAQEYVSQDALMRREVQGVTRYLGEGSFARSTSIGAGLTLIKRAVLERIAEACPDLMSTDTETYASFGVKGPALQCFEALKDEKRGIFLSEDYSFCRRWTEVCGGEVWVCIDELITHVGTSEHQGRLSDRLAFEIQQAAKATGPSSS